MQKIVGFWVCLLCWGWSAHGQNTALTCGDGHYANDLFTPAQVQVTPGVTFGYNTVRNYYTSSEGGAEALLLDVYQPAGDAAQQRPLLLFAFGGAFVAGARTDAEVVRTCQAVARKGYVAAAIDYRLMQLAGPDLASNAALSANNITDEVIRAAADIKAPIRYFKRDAATTNAYHIDPAHTFVGGDHGSPVSDAYRGDIVNEAAAFFQPFICAAPPVTLTSFSGRVAPDDCTATLTWQTATERNSYAYEVQGSADGQAYAALSTVPSRNRAAGASYSFRVGRLAELHYFRLRMLDIGGAAAYSPVVTLASCGATPLLVAPTPTRDQVTVSGLPAGRCLGVLYSATGQVAAQATGTATLSFRLGSLPPGIYLLKVLGESGATVGTAKVVKE